MQTPCDIIKRGGLLLLSISLLILVSYYIQPIAAFRQQNISMYSNNIYTPVIFENLFNTIKGNVLNFTRPFEHTVVIDASHIFPNETLKHKIIEKSGQSEFKIPILKYNLLGFNISATDIKVKANVKEIGQSNNTRIDFPVMQARDVNVRNGVLNQNFTDVDLSSIYAIYDPQTDKLTFHIPFSIAAKYLFAGS